MKIGFIGAHGTGKTSLAEEMIKREEWKDHVFIPSGVRRISNLVKVNKEAGPYDQLLSTCARIADEEFISESGRRGFISDRTPLDSMAYTTYQFTSVWEGVPREYLNIAEGLVQSHMHKYDALVYFPVYFQPEDDGVRLSDPIYQKNIAALCVRYLNKFNLRYYIVENESIDTRADHLTRLLLRQD